MAILTVGTGKTYSTISAAITAASAGDTVAVYAGGTNNVYAEQITWNKWLNIIGMVANQGITIQPASGNVVTCTAYGLMDNFNLVGTGNVQVFVANTGASVSATLVRRCKASGASGASAIGFDNNTGNAWYENCLAVGMTTGFYATTSALMYARHCAAFKNTYNFRALTAASLVCQGCLAAGGVTADFTNLHATVAVFNVSADLTADDAGYGGVTGFDTADCENYAGNDFRIRVAAAATTLARIASYTQVREDRLGQIRQRNGFFYAGSHDPNPGIVPAPAKVEVGYAYGLDLEHVGTMQPGLLMPAGTRKV